MCVTPLGWAYEKKYTKGDVSICDRLKENVSQRGLGSHRSHGTRAGLSRLHVLFNISVLIPMNSYWLCFGFIFFPLWLCSPAQAMASSTRFS
jgi:hypothetical protein